ncbi:MAG: c-type cytochrome [Verrucomicrobia bacterium]|nr:c-type cytochrome [Verrucomicrobiota bacterium]
MKIHRLKSFSLAALVASSFVFAFTVLAGPDDLRPLKAKTGLAPFSYTNAPEVMPNYVAGARWGTQTDPIRTMQVPLSPEESMKHIVLQPGFGVSLFAAEPQITKPIALAWDERGRLWIAETVDYPNELQPAGQGRDRIKICEDTDGDGRADKFTIFADKLSIPTSLCFANGGLIVIESGHTLFLKDTNGDDVADERRVLFSGWGVNDTHATASNLRYGLDNWIWGTVGYSGFDGTVGGKHHKFGMGVYRFKPDGSELEFVRSSNNNTWGLGITEDGTILGSTANGNASWYMAIPNRFYEAVSGWSAARMETIADSQQFYPITEKVRQVDWHNKYTAGAGHALYTARAFPKEFWNGISFVAEPTGHLVGWFRIETSGSDYKAVNLGSFLASDDEWTAPIVAEVGPDGAVWVIDWYNYIVQHNPVPVGFKNGKGNAYETKLRDKRHGRIYRVTHKDGTPTKQPKLAQASPGELVAALKTDNQLWRMHAQRLLVERGGKDVVKDLLALVRDRLVDEKGLNVGATHALWTLHGLLGGDAMYVDLENTILNAMTHPSASVRRAAIAAFPLEFSSAMASFGAPFAGKLLFDGDAQVRLAMLLVLAEAKEPNERVGDLIALALTEPRNANDRWLRDGLAAAAVRHLAGFGPALLQGVGSIPAAATEVLFTVTRHYASAAPDTVIGAVGSLLKCSDLMADAILDGLVAGWPDKSKPSLSDDDRGTLAEVMKALPGISRDKLLVLVQKWGLLDRFKDQVAASTASLRTQLANAALDDSARVTAAKNLIRLADEVASVRAVLEQVNTQVAPSFANGLLAALGDSRLAATSTELLAQWKRFSPAQRRTAVGALLRRAEWSSALLDAVERTDIRRTELGPEQWQTLRNNSDKTVAERAQKLANGGIVIPTDRETVVKKFLPVASQDGDVARGKEVFTANCAVCHRFNGIGQNIGPDLSGIGARPRTDILAEILDPNRSVEANYMLWNLTTKAGDAFSGRLDGETQTSIDLLDLTGLKHTVQRKDIASLESSNQSIMPNGFEAMGEKDLAAVLAYLATGATEAK